MDTVDNERRADTAEAAVAAFRTETGTDIGDAAADLICNLLHWCDRHSLDPLRQVERGITMYMDERDYPPDGWAPADKLAQVEITTWRG